MFPVDNSTQESDDECLWRIGKKKVFELRLEERG